MKSFFLLTLTILILSSCTKQNQEATVIIDCTGTYLRVKQKDYHVCNDHLIEAYNDGDVITGSFKSLGKDYQCEYAPEIVCEMYHENEGWIEITKILD